MHTLPFLALASAFLIGCGSDTFSASDAGGGTDGASDGGSSDGASADGPNDCDGGDRFQTALQALSADRGCSGDQNCIVVLIQTDCCTYRAFAVNHGFAGDGGVDQVQAVARACLSCPKVACLQTKVFDEQGTPVTCTAADPVQCFTAKCNSIGGGMNACQAQPN